jgi:hypothetical protein
MRSALIRDRHTDFVGVENPSLGAGDTDLVIPVPNTASGIGRLGVVEAGEDTGSILEIVALEAGKASTTVVVTGALVRNGNTNLVGIENPSLGAGHTNLVVPVPNSTS